MGGVLRRRRPRPRRRQGGDTRIARSRGDVAVDRRTDRHVQLPDRERRRPAGGRRSRASWWRRTGRPTRAFGQRAWSLLEPEPGVLLVGTLTDGLYRHDASGFSRVAHGPHHQQIFHMIRRNQARSIACTGAVIDGIKTGGIFVSHDKGSTWSLVWEGENVYCAVELTDGTLFAGARRCLVLESTDGGTTWAACPPLWTTTQRPTP